MLFVSELRACSCGDIPSPTVAAAQSAKVFSGKVVYVHGGGGTERVPALLSGFILVEFEVYAVWKGPAFATMFVETAWWSGSCGVEFYVGQEWLVYSYDGATAHSCGRTRPLSLAQADLEELGRGQEPTPETIEPYPQLVDIIEKTSAASSAPSPSPPAASVLREVSSAWLGLIQFTVVMALAALGWTLFGTTPGNRALSAFAAPFRAVWQSAGRLTGRSRR